MRLKQYYRLWQLARLRLRSEKDYRNFQAYQAQLLLIYFQRYNFDIYGKRLVDLGSGIAGYSQEYARYGASVISLDLTQPRCVAHLNTRPVIADALTIPLSTESVDFVVCASLIEHVAAPEKLIFEIQRILKPGGGCYLSFPPFYSPNGGHEYSPYHYFGEKVALRLKKRRDLVPKWVQDLYQVSSAPSSFSELYQGWGLYPMTIRKAFQLLQISSLRLINVSTRYMPVSFVRWPLLREILTWHVQFLLLKPPGDNPTQ